MSLLYSNDFIFIAVVAACIFIFCYLMSDKIIDFMYRKTMGQREELYKLMDAMYLDTDRRKLTISLYLLSYGLGFIVFLLLWPNIFAGLFMGVLVAIAGWSLPKTFLQRMWEKRCSRVVEQMVDGMVIMANSVKAGLSVSQGMERVIENMNGPLPQEFELVLNRVRLGASLEDALNEFGERIPKPDVQMFVTAVNILKETGGNLAETFTTITVTIRERQKVEKKIEAMTTQGINQARIISSVPFGLLLMFLITDPAFVMPMFTRPLGWFALFLMIGLMVIGGVLMKKIVTIKV